MKVGGPPTVARPRALRAPLPRISGRRSAAAAGALRAAAAGGADGLRGSAALAVAAGRAVAVARALTAGAGRAVAVVRALTAATGRAVGAFSLASGLVDFDGLTDVSRPDAALDVLDDFMADDVGILCANTRKILSVITSAS